MQLAFNSCRDWSRSSDQIYLEKRHIFEFKSDILTHDGQLFIFYAVMGMLTTSFFWGIEYISHWLFATGAMCYLGGAIGLMLGYIVKYRLDRHSVFVPKMPATQGEI